jgi:threonine aldolase
MVLDYRSDTVTKPSAPMLRAMMEARIGDDVFGEDPSINELEMVVAAMFGKEAGLFCPSGTMTNQIAIKCHTRPGDEVICDESSHIYQYEGGGIAVNSGASVKLLTGDRGRINAEQVLSAINEVNDDHKARTRLVCLENTSNRGGGSCYDIEEIRRIAEVCKNHNLSLHLDGARLWNAMVARMEGPQEYGPLFHSISICLSKGLGCPAGSLLLGGREFIGYARRTRKVFGGGMRQAGILAAAGIYALQNNLDRLSNDHEHAKKIGECIAHKNFVSYVLPVETNIVIFELKDGITSDEMVRKFEQSGILSHTTSPKRVRLVTHLDINTAMVDETIRILNEL